MKTSTVLASLGSTLALSSLAQAQQDYAFNWHTMNFGFLGGARIAEGPVAFGFGQTFPNWAGPGDSIRICYGIDSTQGGRMQTGAAADIHWFTLVQGYSPNNTVPGVDYGLVSFLSASVDSLSGDACFSSHFGQGTDTMTGSPVTLNNQFSFAMIPGLLVATKIPAPTVWFSYFQFLSATGRPVPNTLGVQPGFPPFPLLANIIMEVQGPLTGGQDNNQYFVLSNAEVIGLGSGGPTGTGGVTNGNARQGESIWGVFADLSNSVSHNRLTSFDTSGGLVGITNTVFGGGPGTDQWFGHIGTQTPALWASQNGNTGAGGPDWRVSNQTSLCNLRVLDMRGGAEGGGALFIPGSGAATSVSILGLAANFPFVVWSCSPAQGMLQAPMCWDAIPPVFAQAGSISLGGKATERDGLQTVAINFDACTSSFLGQSVLSSMTNFQAARDPFADGSVASLFEDGVGEGIDGSSQFTPGALPIGPHPSLANRNLGVVAFGIQFDLFLGELTITESTSSLTLTLQ
jgi:hypothetical protein